MYPGCRPFYSIYSNLISIPNKKGIQKNHSVLFAIFHIDTKTFAFMCPKNNIAIELCYDNQKRVGQRNIRQKGKNSIDSVEIFL